MIKKYIHLFFLLLFVLVKCDSLQAQEPYYWQLTDEDGLPSMTVYQITQAQTGLIWIATANGLCSFDGKNIKQYDDSALNDQEILKIQEAPDGKIWGINLSGQLFFLNDAGKLEVVEKIGEVKLSKVTQFYLFDTKIIIGEIIKAYVTNSMTYDFQTKKTELLNDKIKGNIGFIIKNNTNEFIVESQTSESAFIYQFHTDSDNIKLCFQTDSIINHHIGIYKNQVLFPYRGGRIKKMGLTTGTYQGFIYLNDLTKNIRTINGKTFFILNQGVKKYDGVIEEFLFPTKSMNDVFLDKENNLLFASNEGIFIVPSEKTTVFNTLNSTLSSSKITAIFKDKQNNIFFGNDNGYFNTYHNNSTINPKPTEIKGRILFIEKAGNNIIYGGDSGIRDNLNIIPKANIGAKCFFYSSKGRYFYGASYAFGDVTKKQYNRIFALRTYAIAETPDGTIWIGSDKGIYTYDGKETKPFLDENGKQTLYRISAMKTDADGRLWATSTGHGVVVIKDGKVEKTLNEANGFYTNTFNCLYIENGIVWLGSDKGVIRYNPATGETLLINKYYGLPSDEILALCTDKETLLIGTAKGLVTIPFDALIPNMIAPNLHLLQVKVNEVLRKTTQSTIELSHNENNILIEYISYQYRSRGNARYEYRITELDTAWTMTDQRSLRFPNLSAGDYHFELRAINENDLRSEETIRLHFQIAKPFWLRWWFIGSVLGLVGFGVWGYSYMRFRRMQEQQALESSFKSKMGDLKMQALQAQMNPHFIFNALNAIQHFLTINDEENAVKFLSKFAKLIRIVFEYSKKKEITFANEIEMLDVYLSLEKLRFKEKIDIHFNISEEVEAQKENIYIPPLLIQPIIENSFKHGLFHKNTKGNLYISFDLENRNVLKCVIEDDGVGRTEANAHSIWREKQQVSSGLATTKERIQFWHEKNNATANDDLMRIEDLEENGIAKGTRITIKLSLKNWTEDAE
jgi:ligand-binding sensor domain-containing protein